MNPFNLIQLWINFYQPLQQLCFIQIILQFSIQFTLHIHPYLLALTK